VTTPTTRYWQHQARCIKTDLQLIFRNASSQPYADMLCDGCPVRVDCLTFALNNRIEFGVWGGLSEGMRRRALRRSPDVRDWRAAVIGAEYFRQFAKAAGPLNLPKPRPPRSAAASSKPRPKVGLTPNEQKIMTVIAANMGADGWWRDQDLSLSNLIAAQLGIAHRTNVTNMLSRLFKRGYVAIGKTNNGRIVALRVEADQAEAA
jgi:WhiB family transcriptional regulator, redox-sensing transcriptional regulator